MSLMPFSHYVVDASGFSITAGTSFGYEGYGSSSFESSFGLTAFGSASGDVNADGGTVEALYWEPGESAGNILAILGGGQSATNINIDGTDYTLTFSSTLSGYDFYSFGGGVQRLFDGVTYEVNIT